MTNRTDRESKKILVRLVVLYEHLDRLRALPKPRSEKVNDLIEAIYIRIEREKQKLRKGKPS